MKRQGKRVPKSSDVARLDFHDAMGNVYDRIKGKVTQKERGISMINRIEDRFNISQFDIEEFRKALNEKEIEDFKELQEEARRKDRQPIKWTRDKRGKIISPFSTNRKDNS